MTAIADCGGCHTNPNDNVYLTGGQVFATPSPLYTTVHTVRSAAANLVGASHGFFSNPAVGYSDLPDAHHRGCPRRGPDARAAGVPDALRQFYRNMTSDDLQAIYVYL